MSELIPTRVGSTGLYANTSSASCQVHVNVPLYPCTLEDTAELKVPTGVVLATYEPVSVYGSKGFVELRRVNSRWQDVRKLWKQCRNVVYCDGPEVEGETSSEFNRFHTRWKFLYEDGVFSYGRVGEPLVPVSAVLFPDPYVCQNFSVAFDQNSRPVFALENAGACEIRRLEAGSLTVVAFDGTTPVLFQNALLQFDTSVQDVVCYYLFENNLCGRWQRNEFADEYVLVENAPVDELRCVRAYADTSLPFEFLLCLSGCSTRAFVSEFYPSWPVVVDEPIATSVSIGNALYWPVIIPISDVDDSLDSSVSLSSGELASTIVSLVESDSMSGSIGLGTATFTLTVIVADPISDTLSSSLSVVAAVYTLTVIPISDHSDNLSSTLSIGSGIYALA